MRSLTTRLVLAFLIVGVAGAMSVAFLVNRRTDTEFNRFLADRRSAQLVSELGTYYAENGQWNGVEQLLNSAETRDPSSGFVEHLYLLDVNRRVLVGPAPRGNGSPRQPRNLDVAAPIEVDGEVVGWLAVDMPRFAPRGPSPEEAFRNNMKQATLLSVLGASLLALFLGLLLARTITKPIRKLTAATRALSEGELGRQVDVRSRDEIGQLADSFNLMSADLARSTELRQQMTADIAHDLRTPLSVILGYTEALADGKLRGSPDMFDIMHNEAQQLNYLIDDLRTLSLADAGELSLNRIPIAVGEILARPVAAYQVQAEGQGVALAVAESDSNAQTERLLVNVDPTRMNQVLSNLVSNALRYTPTRGSVTLSAGHDGETVRLKVHNDGSGINPHDLQNIFERFYRGDESRHENGESGLGLPIAKSLVEAHGGRLTVASEAGVGTTFTIALPLDEAAEL